MLDGSPVTDPRWLLTLISELPDDGALAASLQGGHEFRGWGHDRILRAALWNLTMAANHDRKKGKAPTWPTPEAKTKPVSLMSMAPGHRRRSSRRSR